MGDVHQRTYPGVSVPLRESLSSSQDFSFSLQISQCANKPLRSVSEQTELGGVRSIRDLELSGWVVLKYSLLCTAGAQLTSTLINEWNSGWTSGAKLTVFVQSYVVSSWRPGRQAGGLSAVRKMHFLFLFSISQKKAGTASCSFCLACLLRILLCKRYVFGMN